MGRRQRVDVSFRHVFHVLLMTSPFDQIVGIAHEHDAGAALLAHGGLQAAVNEERFNRRKLTTDLPRGCLAWLKTEGGLDPARVQAVALGSRLHVERFWEEDPRWLDAAYRVLDKTRLDRLLFGTSLGSRLVTALVSAIWRPWRMRRVRALLVEHGLGSVPIRTYAHHEAHAASAYLGSGYPEALVITLDAQGDGDCSHVYVARHGRLERKHRIPFFHSPGNYYEYVTHILGFKPGREGKVTGLAARGDPERALPVFRARLRYDARHRRFHNTGGFRKSEISYLKEHLKNFSREDVAAGVQRHLEDVVSAYVRQMLHVYGQGLRHVVVAGGVFANVKLNQRVAELPGVERLYIFPHMGDGGLAAGAAMAHAMRYGLPCHAVDELHLGPGIHDADAEAVLRAHGLSFERPADLAQAVAERLAQGNVVAVCRGAMEFGPRALGNRSILYQATDPTVNDWLNQFLRRSEFMPFAPILREEDFEAYFSGALEQSRHAARTMTITLHATKRCRSEAPAIVHVDNTARPQLVARNSNPFIYRVLEAYHALTGLRILINTSFNMHEEPIVCSALDGVRAFLDGHLDTLVLGPYLVTQHTNET